MNNNSLKEFAKTLSNDDVMKIIMDKYDTYPEACNKLSYQRWHLATHDSKTYGYHDLFLENVYKFKPDVAQKIADYINAKCGLRMVRFDW